MSSCPNSTLSNRNCSQSDGNNNHSTRMPFPYQPLGHLMYFSIGICAVIIFITALYGNVELIRSTHDHTQKKIRQAMNIFIMTLAIYDILIITITMPLTLVEDLMLLWPFGKILCHILYYLPTIFATGSVFTIVAIAGERYRAVIYPMKPKLSTDKAIKIVVLIFILAACTAAPTIIFSVYDDKTYPDHPQCFHTFPPDAMLGDQIYIVFVFGFLFWLPLVFTGVLYILIMYHLRFSRQSAFLNINGRKAAVTNRRVVTMLLIVLLVFFFSWLPLHICFFLAIFGSISTLSNAFRISLTICHIISYLNCTINPIVYVSFKNRSRIMSTICCGSFFHVDRGFSNSDHFAVPTKTGSCKSI